MAKSKTGFMEFGWPLGGMSTHSGFTHQEAGTCVDCQNVRGYDPKNNSLKGAQRSGLSRYINAQVSGTASVQCLDHVSVSAQYGGGTSARTLTGVAVSLGNVVSFTRTGGFVTATNGNGALSSTCPYVGSAIVFYKVYFADGVNWKYWDATTNTVTAMVADFGQLPADGLGNAPRLITSWRGRLVWSGLVGDPTNWFMSRQFDPLDYDYNPNVITRQNSQQAVSGNNSEAGLVPDIVNSMIPYSDDVLIFLGDSSMWQATGDLAAGGQIDRISDTVGGAFGMPWCKDAYGTVYFWGSRGGFYAFHPMPGSPATPVRVSSMRIDNQLLDVDMSANIVRMMWDDRFQTVMIYITPIAGGTTTNWAYDVRNQAFYKDVFGNSLHNPTSVHLMDGDLPGDRVALLGGQDGFVRKLDQNSEDDDGTAINSYVVLGPIQAEGARLRLRELRVVLGMTSDPATIELFAGNSAQEAFNAPEPYFSQTLYPGRNPAIRSGAVAQNFYLKIQNSALRESWQFEALYAWLEGTGRAAGRILV